MSWRLACAAYEVCEGLSAEEIHDDSGPGDQELRDRLCNLRLNYDLCLSMEDLS